MKNQLIAYNASKADRKTLFSQKERTYISNALRSLWNDTPVRHTAVREKVNALIDEFDPFDSNE